MRCAQCGNEDPRYFVYDKGMYYCRRCISFSRCNVGETIVSASLKQAVYHCRPKLKFDLTNDQKRVSQEILMHLKNGKDVFVYAATGFRVIIVTVANSLGNIRVFELLPKLKTKKYGWCIA